MDEVDEQWNVDEHELHDNDILDEIDELVAVDEHDDEVELADNDALVKVVVQLQHKELDEIDDEVCVVVLVE